MIEVGDWIEIRWKPDFPDIRGNDPEDYKAAMLAIGEMMPETVEMCRVVSVTKNDSTTPCR